MDMVAFLGAWFLASVVASLLIGRIIRNRDAQVPTMFVNYATNERHDDFDAVIRGTFRYDA